MTTPTTAAPKRYITTEFPDGFEVRRRPHPLDVPGTPRWLVELANEQPEYRRVPVTAVRHPYCIEVRSGVSSKNISFFNYYGLVEAMAERIMARWSSPRLDEDDEEGPTRHDAFVPIAVERWARRRTAWSINAMIHRPWKRLLGVVHPTVLDVQKRIFSACYGYGDVGLTMTPEFYRDPFLVQDLLKYRAAAVAALYCGRNFAADQALGMMSDWKSVFSPTGSSYGALNRTLMNLPGGVPPRVLIGLRRFELTRAVTDRLELTTTILANRHGLLNARVCSSAEGPEIAEALRRISRHLRQDLSTRRWRDVLHALLFLGDYPEVHRGNIVGLAEKSIRWHQDQRARIIDETIARHGHDKEVARPPIPLPDEPGIRFLARVGDVCLEGHEMRHCIASYVAGALAGDSYLFHVEYRGEPASVEVSHYGFVVQASGPRNQKNEAAEWGRKRLSGWGRRLRKALLSSDRMEDLGGVT